MVSIYKVGKTVTVVEAINQVFKQIPQSKILVCAPSNSAADLLLQRLSGMTLLTSMAKLLVTINKSNMIRINAYSRDPSPDIVPKTVLEYSYKDGTRFGIPNKEYIVKNLRVVVVTCMTAAQLYTIGIPDNFFSHVFIDEAGHSTEPETLASFVGLVNR
jgi:helicase MOV-10